MVCPRCIEVVKSVLLDINILFKSIELGHVTVTNHLSSNDLQEFMTALKPHGFEIVSDKNSKLVEDIKSLIINNIHHQKGAKSEYQNYSDYLSEKSGVDYTSLSKLFSSVEGKTIEKYILLQKVERAKELLTYKELNISEIAYELDYSSPQHFARQFKQLTGLSPSYFKKIGTLKRIPLNDI